jgi:hypothetical protein
MATVRIPEAELARDVRTVLEKVEHGSEVIIEREDHRPLAVISARPYAVVGPSPTSCVKPSNATQTLLRMKTSAKILRKLS